MVSKIWHVEKCTTFVGHPVDIADYSKRNSDVRLQWTVDV